MSRGVLRGLVATALFAGGCAASGEATEIMLTVDTDLDPAEVDYALVRVFFQPEGGLGGAPDEGSARPRLDLERGEAVSIRGVDYEHRFTHLVRVSPGETFPIELGVVPEGNDHDRIAYFEAFALRCDDPERMTACGLVTATGARTAFVPRRRVRLVLWLTAACSAEACPLGEVCRYDGCRPLDFPPECLIDDEITGSERPLCMADLAECASPPPFNFTSTPEPIVVPNRVRFILIKAWGAGGNDVGACAPVPDGGPGGFTAAVFPAEPGLVLQGIVGEAGSAAAMGTPWRYGFGAVGGGGLTGVFRGDAEITALDRDRALVIAGGGGSGAGPTCQGGGPGNDPSGGGAPTMAGEIQAGGGEIGGGGGYAGGLAGGGGTPARGGTGFVDMTRAMGTPIVEAGARASDTPPRTTDEDYGVDPSSGRGAGTTEASGRLIVKFLCENPLI